MFHGPTGVGKTAAAFALAWELGCSIEEGELGGVWEIPSGKQDGRAVDDLLRSLHLRPMFGSGWRVAIINEADRMSTGAETIWLDGLEQLPGRSVVVFTTNEIARLTDRLIGRCELVEFVGTGQPFIDSLRRLVRKVWLAETGRQMRAVPENLGRLELGSVDYSIRLALQQIAPYARGSGTLPKGFGLPIVRTESAADRAWQTRRRKTAILSNQGG